MTWLVIFYAALTLVNVAVFANCVSPKNRYEYNYVSLNKDGDWVIFDGSWWTYKELLELKNMVPESDKWAHFVHDNLLRKLQEGVEKIRATQ